MSAHENLGPSEEADAEFAKELAKMVTDSSNESRKVDKKTAMALWDSAVLPPGARKRRGGDGDGEGDPDPNATEAQPVMNFTLLTKRGNKQQVRDALGVVGFLIYVLVGSPTRGACCVGFGCTYTVGAASRQRGTAASEEAGLGLRAA